MIICYIGVGSNIGDRRKFIDSSIAELKKVRGISVTRLSSIYETEPVSDIQQRKYLNGVVEIETDLDARVLLKELNRIEDKLGRKRTIKNAPRTIDMDILYYGNEHLNEKDLIIPHPRIKNREFVLKGLRELGIPHLLKGDTGVEEGAG
ncbi:MAG: 2-amino-4-hydroxy-6-hydroxymethyldihydropteridine diphosphokinase [Candidatus Omnitrophota bacterium]|nr:2-amino-4-hydroxy-6-hydroxymethyldihydropteridine diphosphokinase [Candidatus Omnitrophota bacterium]